jgi:hypothetical protein
VSQLTTNHIEKDEKRRRSTTTTTTTTTTRTRTRTRTTTRSPEALPWEFSPLSMIKA